MYVILWAFKNLVLYEMYLAFIKCFKTDKTRATGKTDLMEVHLTGQKRVFPIC